MSPLEVPKVGETVDVSLLGLTVNSEIKRVAVSSHFAQLAERDDFDGAYGERASASDRTKEHCARSKSLASLSTKYQMLERQFVRPQAVP